MPSPAQLFVWQRTKIYCIVPKLLEARFQGTFSKSRVCMGGCSNLVWRQRALFFTLTSLLFYFPEFPSWPYDFRFQFISFTPKRQKCILIYERHQYSAWARARLCWPSNKRELNIRWSDRGSISGMRCTGIRQQNGRYQRNGWHDNFLCVPKDAPYV